MHGHEHVCHEGLHVQVQMPNEFIGTHSNYVQLEDSDKSALATDHLTELIRSNSSSGC